MRRPVVFANDPNLPDVIELRNITHEYPGKRREDPPRVVIRDLSLLFENMPETGDIYTIIGESGCGKSTLLRFIAGLQMPTSGEVLVQGKQRDDKVVVGMVFQQYSSLHFRTVLENVELGLKLKGVSPQERRELAMEVIKIVGLEKEVDRYCFYPKLSGGQLQRVAFARSLIANPGIILMDEPFGALDIRTRQKMQAMLCDIKRNYDITIILVTHALDEAVLLSDRIYVMSKDPAQIVKEFRINLPPERDKETKRMPEYLRLVAEIDDYMTELGSSSEN